MKKYVAENIWKNNKGWYALLAKSVQLPAIDEVCLFATGKSKGVGARVKSIDQVQLLVAGGGAIGTNEYVVGFEEDE